MSKVQSTMRAISDGAMLDTRGNDPSGKRCRPMGRDGTILSSVACWIGGRRCGGQGRGGALSGAEVQSTRWMRVATGAIPAAWIEAV